MSMHHNTKTDNWLLIVLVHYFLFKINENYFSLLKLENGFAFGPNLENLACLKNSIMEVLDLFIVLSC